MLVNLFSIIADNDFINMSKKIQYTVEYPVRCSPAILYEFLSTSSGLQEWFADKVEDEGDLFSFSWSGGAAEEGAGAGSGAQGGEPAGPARARTQGTPLAASLLDL